MPKVRINVHVRQPVSSDEYSGVSNSRWNLRYCIIELQAEVECITTEIYLYQTIQTFV